MDVFLILKFIGAWLVIVALFWTVLFTVAGVAKASLFVLETIAMPFIAASDWIKCRKLERQLNRTH